MEVRKKYSYIFAHFQRIGKNKTILIPMFFIFQTMLGLYMSHHVVTNCNQNYLSFNMIVIFRDIFSTRLQDSINL